MPKNPFSRNKKKDESQDDTQSKDQNEGKNKKRKKGKKGKKASDDVSVASLPSEIGISDAPSKQPAGQSTASKGRKTKSPSLGGGDNVSVASVKSVYSLDPKQRQEDMDKKNASSKHNLGVFYFGKQDYEKAIEYLEVALKARINLHGKKNGHVLETKLAIADCLTGQQKNEEAIALLKKVEATLKTLRREAAEKDDDSVDSAAADINKLLGEKTVDLDALYESTLEKLEGLGVKSNKFVRKGAAEGGGNADMFGSDYKKMNKKQAKDLSDPDVFIRIMKTDDLTQEEIREGMKALNNEVPDSEIYVANPFDEDFDDIPVAQQVLVILEAPMELNPDDNEDEVKGFSSDEEDEEEKKKDEKEEETKDAEQDLGLLEGTVGQTVGAVAGVGLFAVKGVGKILGGVGDVVIGAAGAVGDAFGDTSGDETSTKRNDDDDDRSESSHDSKGTYVNVDEKRAKRVRRRQLKLSTMDLIKTGLDLYADGEIFKARKYYYKHLDEWIDTLGHNNASIINVKEDLGDIEFHFGNYAKARTFFEGASRAIQIVSDEESSDCVRLLQKLGLTKLKLFSNESAGDSFDEAYTMHEKLLEFDTDIGSVTHEEGLFQKATILFMKGDYQRAKVPISEVMRNTAHQGDRRHPLLLNMVGMILFAESRYDEARVYFEKAHKAAKSNGKQITPRQRSNILYNLGYSHVHILQFEEAHNYFKWALDILEKSSLRDFDKKTDEVRILTKLGHSSFHLGELDSAYNYYTKAFNIDMSLYNDDTRSVTLNIRRYIGLTRAHQGRYDDALYVFEGVLYSQSRPDWPNNIVCGKTLIDMSEIYFVCGSLKLSEKMQLRLARFCCKRASEIFLANKLTTDHPYVKQASDLQKMIAKDFRR